MVKLELWEVKTGEGEFDVVETLFEGVDLRDAAGHLRTTNTTL